MMGDGERDGMKMMETAVDVDLNTCYWMSGVVVLGRTGWSRMMSCCRHDDRGDLKAEFCATVPF